MIEFDKNLGNSIVDINVGPSVSNVNTTTVSAEKEFVGDIPTEKRKEQYSTDKAHSLIFGDREKDYGSATKNFNDIAKGWSVIFGTEVTPEQVCIAMTWLKMCRLIKSPGHTDSIVDGIGYLAIIEDKLKHNL